MRRVLLVIGAFLLFWFGASIGLSIFAVLTGIDDSPGTAGSAIVSLGALGLAIWGTVAFARSPHGNVSRKQEEQRRPWK